MDYVSRKYIVNIKWDIASARTFGWRNLNKFTDGGSTLKAVIQNEALLTVERPTGSLCKLQT